MRIFEPIYSHKRRDSIYNHIALVMQVVLFKRRTRTQARVAHLLVRWLSGRLALRGERAVPHRTRASRGPRGLLSKMLSLSRSILVVTNTVQCTQCTM